jgi:hypothetical protein
VVAKVKAAFPELDHYRFVAPSMELDAEPAVASALEDLCDIVQDFEQIRQRADRQGIDDALRYAQQRWPSTGAHLTQLRRFIHYKLFGW